MKSRGEISTTTLIIGIIAVLVAVGSIFLAYKLQIINQDLDNSLVNYNNSKSPVSDGVLRYNLSGNNIEIYTGKAWTNQDGEFIIGDYSFNSDSLKQNIQDYYINSPRSTETGRLIGTNFSCVALCAKLFLSDSSLDIRIITMQLVSDKFTSGGSLISSITGLNGKRYGTLYLTNKNKLFYLPDEGVKVVEISSSDADFVKIVNSMIEIRDSIFEGGADELPLALDARDRRTGRETKINVQPKKLQDNIVIFLGETL